MGINVKGEKRKNFILQVHQNIQADNIQLSAIYYKLTSHTETQIQQPTTNFRLDLQEIDMNGCCLKQLTFKNYKFN